MDAEALTNLMNAQENGMKERIQRIQTQHGHIHEWIRATRNGLVLPEGIASQARRDYFVQIPYSIKESMVI